LFARYIYNHSRYFVLIVLCAVVVGFNSFNSISRQEDPSLTNFRATITTFYPGAAPDRVEALITRPLEDEFREISEIEEIQSTSSTGVSQISVELSWTLPKGNFEQIWSEVRDAMDEAALQFPAGAGKPQFDNDRSLAFSGIVAFSTDVEDEVSLSIISRVAQSFADRARNLPSTRLVEIFGEAQEEIRVEIDEQALLSRGLSIRQVARALHSADVKIASGRATGAGSDLLIELSGELDSLDRIRQVIVSTSSNGAATRVSDLGRVFRAATSPPYAIALAQGRRAVLVGAAMEYGGQVDVWSEAFRALVEDFRQQAPNGISMEQTFDQSGYAKARLTQVGTNLALGVFLVLLVLLFTLGWRAAMVVAVILPLSGLISLTVMERAGMELHQMSISGLIVALGLLVDGSIVMTDEIRKRLLQGHNALESIRASVHRLRVPLLASTFTTILAFMPMALSPGPPGDYIGNTARAVIIMLITSTLLALVITPVLAAWMLPHGEDQSRPWYSGGIHSGRPGRWLVSALDWTLRHPLAGISLALALPISGFLGFNTLTKEFFPGTDRDQLFVQVELAGGRSIYETRELAERVDAMLRAQPLIRRVDWTLGESPPPFFYNLFRNKDGIPTWAEALVLTRDKDKTDDLVRRLQGEVDREFPEARIIARGIDMGPPVVTPIEVEIYGPDLGVLKDLGDRFRQRLEAVPQITHTAVDAGRGAPKLVFALDEDKLRLAQLQLTDAAIAINDSLLGSVGGEVLEGTERLPVRVRLPEQDWATADQIANIRLPQETVQGNPAGLLTGVPLNAIASPELVPAQSPITRLNGQRMNTVRGYLTRGVLPEEALTALRRELQRNPVVLPDGYHFKFGGDSEERAEVTRTIMAPMALIIAALIATLVVTFNSWRLTAIALLVCGCSTGLSLLCLAIFNFSFGIMAMLGVIGSIGVSINAAIIIMTALQAHDSARLGNLVAVRWVVMDSSRHIVSTTLTTFGGFLPLILEGSRFWTPFAMAIAGGVLLSTIISFFLVPPMFVLTMGSRNKTRGAETVSYQRSADSLGPPEPL
jgi:multidrug efflux pump subunit AcrB